MSSLLYFLLGSILEWGDIKKGAITSQSKEYGSSTGMVIQLGWYREMTLVVKNIKFAYGPEIRSQSEEGIKNNLEVLAWKTVWEVVPCIKILGRMEENMTWEGKPSVQFETYWV